MWFLRTRNDWVNICRTSCIDTYIHMYGQLSILTFFTICVFHLRMWLTLRKIFGISFSAFNCSVLFVAHCTFSLISCVWVFALLTHFCAYILHYYYTYTDVSMFVFRKKMKSFFFHIQWIDMLHHKTGYCVRCACFFFFKILLFIRRTGLSLERVFFCGIESKSLLFQLILIFIHNICVFLRNVSVLTVLTTIFLMVLFCK